MTTLLLNAFSLNMLTSSPDGISCSVDVREISLELAKALLAKGFVSAVGHASTAAVFSAVLGVPVEARRTTVELRTGEIAIVGQYRGPRLEEGATSLPEGAEIQWMRVRVSHPLSYYQSYRAARVVERIARAWTRNLQEVTGQPMAGPSEAEVSRLIMGVEPGSPYCRCCGLPTHPAHADGYTTSMCECEATAEKAILSAPLGMRVIECRSSYYGSHFERGEDDEYYTLAVPTDWQGEPELSHGSHGHDNWAEQLPPTTLELEDDKWVGMFNDDIYCVVRTAPSCVDPPCACSHDEEVAIWIGADPTEYNGGLGAFDEGCHHPSLTMRKLVSGEWKDFTPRECTCGSGMPSPGVDGGCNHGTPYCG